MSGQNKNRRLKTIRYCCFSVAVFLLLMTGQGCSKNETPIKESFQTDFNFLAISKDSVQLGIKIDDEIKVNDLIAPADNPKTVTLNYFNNEKKISVYDVSNNQVLFDSLFIVRASVVSLSLYQKNSGEPFVVVMPPSNLTQPPTGYSRISVMYTLDELPDEVKIVAENNKQTGTDYEPTDSFYLRKGEFSPYFLGKDGLRKPRINIYTSDADRRLLAQADPGQFSELTAPFIIYAIRKYRAYNNNVYDLLTQKLY